MNKEIIVDVGWGETRVAVLEEGVLVEIYVERSQVQRCVGNVYKGRVENVLPGMQAAFVNIGLERNAFLFVADARCPDARTAVLKNMNKLSIHELLKPGQDIIVQVTKEAIGSKGARVTTNITLPGRHLVLMPTVDYVGVSRRIVDEEERNRLRALAEEVKLEDMGLIVRTVAEGRGKEEFEQDVKYLLSVWHTVMQRFKLNKGPGLIFRDLDLVCRTIRDLLDKDVSRFVINNEKVYKKVLDFLDYLGPEYKQRVELYQNDYPILEAYGVEAELERALKRKVWLKNGGYLVIDQAEALTVIDVNTGKFVGNKDLADTVLKTNLEAAVEIARQLRLRDIGGIIIIDFIDMEAAEHQEMVIQTLQTALAKDKTKTNILGITQLGLVEMTRKRVRHGLKEVMLKDCPCCEGTGKIMSEESISLKIKRELKKLVKENLEAEAVLIQVNPTVASILIGPNGQDLDKLEHCINKKIFIKGCQEIDNEEAKFYFGTIKEVENMALPVRMGQKLEVYIEEPHATNYQDGIARKDGYVIDVEDGVNFVGENVMVEISKVYKTYAKARIAENRMDKKLHNTMI
ncbi:MAG TPA: Rne/Rng family ribonuclease [Clostridia bacterium]|nr:Rne/Rng family ribonuclease [Clostridia bacterium]